MAAMSASSAKALRKDVQRFIEGSDTWISPISDTGRDQLGWYMRNCANGPAAPMLEEIMLERLERLTGKDKLDPFGIDDEGGGSRRGKRGRERRIRELRLLLQRFDELPASEENLERNALFARDEFRLEPVDTEILLLLLRIERNSDL